MLVIRCHLRGEFRAPLEESRRVSRDSVCIYARVLTMAKCSLGEDGGQKSRQVWFHCGGVCTQYDERFR
jgi:hypothetical protein